MLVYWSLFFAAFLAATIFPFSSELAVVAMVLDDNPAAFVWLSATAGNTLGAAVNWALGRFLLHYRDRRWFPVAPEQLARAHAWYQRWGVWSLLLAWLPLVGDALTLAAGIMRLRFDVFVVLTAIGKGGRYAIVIYAAQQLPG